MNCPRCGSYHVHRIPPAWLQGKLMRLLAPGRRLQQCHICGWRAYAPWKRRHTRSHAEELRSWMPESSGEPDLAAIDAAVRTIDLPTDVEAPDSRRSARPTYKRPD